MDIVSVRLSWLALPVVAWVVWAGLLFLGQRRVVFPRHLVPAPAAGPEDLPGVERLVLETASGPGLAYYLAPAPASASPAPAIVFAHGNAESARDWAGAFRAFAERGVAVALVEYPGYAGAPGAPTLETVGDAMEAAYDTLAARPEVDARRIVGLGRSLGGGAVTELGRRRPLAGLVLWATFTSVREMARGLAMPGFLVLDPFDNLAFVRGYEGPVLVFHGERDDVLPYRHGRRLAEAATDGRLVTWPCAHNDCPPDWSEWVDEVVAFLHGTGSGRGTVSAAP